LSKKIGRQRVYLQKVDVSRAGRTLSDSETELRRASTTLPPPNSQKKKKKKKKKEEKKKREER